MAKATLPTDPFELLQFNMIRGVYCMFSSLCDVVKTVLAAHETFKLGYDKINTVLADPPLDDLDNFLGYCSAWAEAIGEHHDSEVRVTP